MLLTRGDMLLAAGDVSAARLLYQRAASAGSAVAATGAGKTYDPNVLARLGAVGMHPDAGRAASWYRQAVSLGDGEAQHLLDKLAPLDRQKPR
jgi:TPR repeat protein